MRLFKIRRNNMNYEEILKISTAAYANLSHDPEKRGQWFAKAHCAELQEDLLTLQEKDDPEMVAKYRERYISWVREYLAKIGRTANWFITGPARFPVERNRKRMESEQKCWEDFREWRSRFIHKALKSPTLTFEEELQAMDAKLLDARAYVAQLKEEKKIFRGVKDVDTRREKLMELLEDSERVKTRLQTGFHDYETTYASKRVRELEKRQKDLENRITFQEQHQEEQYVLGSLKCEEDRVLLVFTERPDEDLKKRLKSKAFKWSPTREAWVRKLTNASVYDSRQILKG
jgi:hypothetical protein